MNECTLIGNVGRDPEIRYQQNGDPIATFTLATSERWKGKDGTPQEKTQWHRCEVFGKTAQFVRDYVKKGTKLLVRGSIDYQEWTYKDGQKKYGTKIKVSGPKCYVEFNGPKPKAEADELGPFEGQVPDKEPFQATDEDVPF